MATSILEQYKKVFDLLQGKRLDGDEFTGRLQLNEEIVGVLTNLQREGLTSGSYLFSVDGVDSGSISLAQLKPAHFAPNICFDIDLSATKLTGSYAICKDWNYLISYEEKILNPVESVFFSDSGHVVTIECNDTKFSNYRSLHNVAALIKTLAITTEGNGKTIFYERPLSFEFILTESDLNYPIDIEAIEKLLNKDLHKEAIACLICKELVSFLKDISVKKRFSHLIQHLSSFVSNVLLSYKSYVESYSFDKVRKEYLEKNTEYIKKINEVFDNAATKLLSIPAGLWFATSQIKLVEVSGPSLILVKNLGVLLTVACLVVMVVLNLSGQLSTLKSIRNEYTGVFGRLEASFEEESENIKRLKAELDSKEFIVVAKVWVSISISLILFAFTLAYFCMSFK